MRLGRVWAVVVAGSMVGAIVGGGTVASADPAARSAPALGTSTGGGHDLAAAKAALAARLDASASGAAAPGALAAPRETPDITDQIIDPVFDVSEGRGDISAAGVTADGTTQLISTMAVRQFSNAFSDPNWVVGDSGALWSYDVNLDLLEDYYAVMFNISGSLVGGVFVSSTDAFLCDAVTFSDPNTSMYALVFQPGCIGLSTGSTFNWGATLGYDVGATIQFDDAPDTTWAGPVTNVAPPPFDTSSLNPLVPARLVDTRVDGLTIDGRYRGTGRQPAGTVLEVAIAGRGGVPGSASAVWLNVTAVLPSQAGFLTVFACGGPAPTTSNVNYLAGQVVPNAVLAKLSATGSICIRTLAETDLLVDVNGFVPAGAAPVPLDPQRYLETRAGVAGGTFDGLFLGAGKSPAGSVTEVLVAGRGAVPADATAVMMNITAVAPDAPGFLTVFPCGEAQPVASHVNYQALQVAPNAVLSKVGAGGKVCIATLATTDLIVDVNGFVPAGGTLTPLVPARVLETRPGGTTIDGRFAGIGRGPADRFTRVLIAGRAEVPSTATSVMLNVTAVPPSGDGFLTVWPCDEDMPVASNVNYRAGQVNPNAVLAKLSAVGEVCIYTLAASDVVVDVSGYVG